LALDCWSLLATLWGDVFTCEEGVCTECPKLPIAYGLCGFSNFPNPTVICDLLTGILVCFQEPV
jgi:hypothetical protein